MGAEQQPIQLRGNRFCLGAVKRGLSSPETRGPLRWPAEHGLGLCGDWVAGYCGEERVRRRLIQWNKVESSGLKAADLGSQVGVGV